MIKNKKKFMAVMFGALCFGRVTQAVTTGKIEPMNVINTSKNVKDSVINKNINKKALSPLKVYGTMIGSFLVLAALVTVGTIVGLKISDKNFEKTDAGKKYDEYKKECEEVDNSDIPKKEKEMAKQRLWAKYYAK